MRGHVHKRGQTWTYVVAGGRDRATGRRRQRTKGGIRTKRLAEDALAAALQPMHDGSFVATDPQPVGEWIDRWLVAMTPRIRASTLRDYRMGLSRVKARLGHVRLQELRPLDVEELYASLLEGGHRFGGGLAPRSVNNVPHRAASLPRRRRALGS